MTESNAAPSPSPALEWNLDLLDEAIARIEANPDEWQQQYWRCGTGCCLAGHVALIGGARWVTDNEDDDDFDRVVPQGSGEAVDVDEHALVLLGMDDDGLDVLLDTDDARCLFYGSNSLDDLKGMARDLRAARDAAKAVASR